MTSSSGNLSFSSAAALARTVSRSSQLLFQRINPHARTQDTDDVFSLSDLLDHLGVAFGQSPLFVGIDLLRPLIQRCDSLNYIMDPRACREYSECGRPQPVWETFKQREKASQENHAVKLRTRGIQYRTNKLCFRLRESGTHPSAFRAWPYESGLSLSSGSNE